MKILRKILAIAYLTVVATDLAGASTVITVISSKKNPAEENRMVSGFDGISSSGSYNVYITMDNTESLRLEGDQEQISQIDTKVENGILKIRNKKQMSHRTWSNRGKVNVYITAKTLNSLVLSGSGDIEVKGRVNSEKFSNTISGSGSISSNLDVKDYTATISGSARSGQKEM
ncbi:MAG: DUF2807 domain-containing protein [Pedobacter sp.]|jgi:hypothetical protein